MAMSNAELEVALKAALQRLVTALANKVAPDSLKLEGKSLAEITSLILAGKAATAGTADNALAVGGKDLTTLETERAAALAAAIDALRTELEGSIGDVTAESLGLGNVVNYGVATEEEALNGAIDKYVTAQLAVKIAQAKIDEIVGAAPETLDTLAEIAAALKNDPDVINTLMSNIGVNATAIEALETAVGVFEAKVMGYFDVDGNANNANLFAGKTLNEVLDMARDGVDMSNVVLKTDDFGQYKVGLASDTTVQEVQELVVAADSTGAAAHIVRTGDDVVVSIVGSEGDWLVVTEAEMGSGWANVQQLIDAQPAGDFDTYYKMETVTREVTAPASTLKMLIEQLQAFDQAVQGQIDTRFANVDGRLDEHSDRLSTKAEQSAVSDMFNGAMAAVASLNEGVTAALEQKVAKGSNIDSNTVLVNEEEVALSQVIANIKGEIASTGQASGESLALLEQKVDNFIAAKATGEEAITGEDDSKYLTALALKAALDALDLSGKLDVNAQAADSALLEGNSLAQIIAKITQGEGKELALKVDISENWAAGSNITLDRVFFYDAVGDEIEYEVDLAGVQVVDGSVNYINGKVELSDLNTQPSVVITGFGEVPPEVTHVNIEFTNLYTAKGTFSVVNAADDTEVFGSYAFDAAGTQLVRDPSADGFDIPFTMPAAGGLSLSSLQSQVDVLKGRASTLETDVGNIGLRVDDLEQRAGESETQVRGLEDRIEAAETNKLDATAQAVDSAKLEGKSIADLTASSEEAVVGEITDKFMTPGTAKDAFDARWAEKVGAAPETLDTIEEIALALRNNPDSLAAVETVAKQYTDTEVLAAIAQISGENMEAGTTLASLYAQVVALQDAKLDKTATAVNSDKLGGKSLMEVIDSAIQPGRLFYPVVHVNGSLADDNYVMPSPADVWAQVKTNAVMEQVDTIYAVGVKRLLPGNLLTLTNQEGMTLRGAVSEAQEGPGYVIMRAGIEDTEWTVITDPLLGCVARLSKHCVVVGDNTERFVPGQTLFYNGFEALSENVYYDWTLMADKEWEVATFTGTDLVIDSARYHRSEIRIQSTGPVTVTFDVPTDLPYEMEVRFVNQTGVEVTFAGSNVVSVPRMQQYTLTKVNGVVRAVRYTNTSVALAGDMDEAFFANPDYSAPQA